ncbi:MAG: ABC transporter substrate-binding protein [Desulfobacteraceae bacterium]|nr:ABC transporter substrate-binding protein [Desulfobacteraceae bacterium]
MMATFLDTCTCIIRNRCNSYAKGCKAMIVVFLCCLAQVLPGRAVGEPGRDIVVLAPATPASIPLILAVDDLPGVGVKIFHNHSQAHSLFLRKQAQFLTTGISVGVRFFRQGVPLKIINSHVAGLSFLVSTRPVKGFGELKGEKIWLPFPGSPLEEVTRFFARSEGLVWQRDIRVGYAMFDSSVKMLQQGRIGFAALPEPFVSLAEAHAGLVVSLDYAALWERYTGSRTTCPQVGTFVNAQWAKAHPELIVRFNQALARAIERCATDPGLGVQRAGHLLRFPGKILDTALGRTRFELLMGQTLKQGVTAYYKTIGSPLDETFNDFF